MKIPYPEKSGHFQYTFFSFKGLPQHSQVFPLSLSKKKNQNPNKKNSTVLINKDLHMQILLGRKSTRLVIARAPRKTK